jgi:hypothetical protein
MEFKPGQFYELKGKEDCGSYYKVWLSKDPLKVMYVRDEKIEGNYWCVFAALEKEFKGIGLTRVRISKEMAQSLDEGLYINDNIVTKRVISKPADRLKSITEFIDAAWKLLGSENSQNPEASVLRKTIEDYRRY